MRPLLTCLALFSLVVALGCDRTVEVAVTPDGFEKLQLRGDSGAEGRLLRPVKHGAQTFAEDTRVRVLETWLVRKDGSTRPPGYRIVGLYDPTKRTDGLMLPRHAVETYYFATVPPEHKLRVAVPARWFERTP